MLPSSFEFIFLYFNNPHKKDQSIGPADCYVETIRNFKFATLCENLRLQSETIFWVVITPMTDQRFTTSRHIVMLYTLY